MTNVPDGEYCLVTTADPDGQLLESSRTDNTYQRIRSPGDGVVARWNPAEARLVDVRPGPPVYFAFAPVGGRFRVAHGQEAS